jgi:acyl carrier protein
VSSVDTLYETIAVILGVDPAALTEESSPDTVASWDSVNHLNLVMALESEFEIQLSPDDALAMRSVRAIRGILRERGASF